MGSASNFFDSGTIVTLRSLGINDIPDVNTSGVTSGQVLKYNAATSKWEPADDLVGSGGSFLSASDINTYAKLNTIVADATLTSSSDLTGFLSASDIANFVSSSTIASTYADVSGDTFTGAVAFNTNVTISGTLNGTNAANLTSASDIANFVSSSTLASTYADVSGDTFTGAVTIQGRLTIDDALEETSVTNAATGATETLDLSSASVFDMTMDASCTFTFSNPPADSTGFTLILRQGSGGSKTATWPASVDWPGGAAPTLSTTSGSVDIVTFITADGGTTWFGFEGGLDFS